MVSGMDQEGPSGSTRTSLSGDIQGLRKSSSETESAPAPPVPPPPPLPGVLPLETAGSETNLQDNPPIEAAGSETSQPENNRAGSEPPGPEQYEQGSSATETCPPPIPVRVEGNKLAQRASAKKNWGVLKKKMNIPNIPNTPNISESKATASTKKRIMKIFGVMDGEQRMMVKSRLFTWKEEAKFRFIHSTCICLTLWHIRFTTLSLQV